MFIPLRTICFIIYALIFLQFHSFHAFDLLMTYPDDRQNFLWNQSSFGQMRPTGSSTWEGSYDFKVLQMKGSLMKSTKVGGIDGQLHLPNSQRSNTFSTLSHEVDRLLPFKGPPAEVLNHGNVSLLVFYLRGSMNLLPPPNSLPILLFIVK